MTDFGANIFDDAPVQSRKAERSQPREEAAAAPTAPPPQPAAERARPPANEPQERSERPFREPRRDDRRPDRHERRDDRRGGPSGRHDDRRESRDEPREPRREPREEHPDRGERRDERPHRSEETRGHRDDRRDNRPDRREPRETPPPRRESAVIPPPPSRRANTVHVVVDLSALEADARNQGGEVLHKRLLATLGNGREVAGATCFAPPQARVPAGFDVQPADAGMESGLRFAADAIAASAHGTVVLAPASPAITALAIALNARGGTVEVVGFTLADGVPGARKLGRDSLFIP